MDVGNEQSYYGNLATERGSKTSKRMEANEEYEYTPTASPTTSWRFEANQKRAYACSELSVSDPVLMEMVHEWDSGRYGSVSKEMEDLIGRKNQITDVIYAMDPNLPITCSVVQNYVPQKLSKPTTP